MAATNYSVFRPKHVDAIKFGTATLASNLNNSGYVITGASTALDTMFSDVQSTTKLDLVGSRDANSPVASEAFAKDITISGNERSVEEENLLGADTSGTQNQETNVSNTSLMEVTFTCVYRNPVPFSVFNDSTRMVLMTLDNSESSATGVINILFDDITMLQVGALTMNQDGLFEQTVKFSCSAGTSGNPISVSDGGETWYRVTAGSYAEECRLT